jgi:hypothetical protein
MPYASVILLDVPIVVQYTRLDSRQAENALGITGRQASASSESAGVFIAQMSS